jgi:hypothetical protein
MHKLGLFLLTTAMAHGAIVTYTDRTAFLAALSGPTFENDFQTMPTSAVGSPRSFSGNGFGYQISAVNGLIGIDIGGDISIAAVTGTSALNVINLTGGVTAVGGYFFFDANTAVSTTGAGTLTANNGVDPAAVMNVTAPTSLTGFFGFISTSGVLTSVSLQKTSGGGFPDLDDLIVGTAATGSPVPEPATWSMLAVAGLAIALRRRRT